MLVILACQQSRVETTSISPYSFNETQVIWFLFFDINIHIENIVLDLYVLYMLLGEKKEGGIISFSQFLEAVEQIN